VAAVHACDPGTGRTRFLLHVNDARAWAVSADRRFLATAGWHVRPVGGTEERFFEVRCYELAAWADPIVLVRPDEGPAEAARGLAFTPDGQSAAALLFGPNPRKHKPWAGVYLWNTTGGQLRREWPSPIVWDGLAFGPAGNWFLTWAEGRLHLWSLPDGNRVSSADAPGHSFAGLVVSPDGRWLAEPHARGVSIWRVPELRPHASLRGHPGWVTAVEFAPDGRTLMTAGEDQTVRTWDVETGQQQHALAWEVGEVGALAFARDGLTAAAGGRDGQVVVWDLA
jgi:WD40 repeat protein